MTKISDRDGWIWLDGAFVPWRDANVHVLTHTLHYGLGVFEGIRAYETERGAAIFRLEEHITRLFQSAYIYGMKIPFSQQEVMDACIESVSKNNLKNAYIRPMCFYGSENMGLRAKNLSTRVTVAAWDWGKYFTAEQQEKGLRLKTSSFARHHVNVSMCRAKCNGHYVNSMAALSEALDDGYDEALMLTTEGFVSEGTGENLFLVRKNKLITPELSSCLEGITRDTVIEIAEEMGYKTECRRVTRDEVYISDEAFLCGTACEIAAVAEVDRKAIGTGKRGKLTKAISDAYFAVVMGKNEKYRSYLSLCSQS